MKRGGGKVQLHGGGGETMGWGETMGYLLGEIFIYKN